MLLFGLWGGIRGSAPAGQIRGLREGNGAESEQEIVYRRIELVQRRELKRLWSCIRVQKIRQGPFSGLTIQGAAFGMH